MCRQSIRLCSVGVVSETNPGENPCYSSQYRIWHSEVGVLYSIMCFLYCKLIIGLDLVLDLC